MNIRAHIVRPYGYNERAHIVRPYGYNERARKLTPTIVGKEFNHTIITIKHICSMRKLINLYKRNIAVFAIVLMSINTFATTASNDGSSFVTKAEFDKLMNGFNDRMNEYQAALNAKIDQAVSGYIAGMSAQAVLQLDNYAKLASDSNVNNIKFAAWTTPQESKNVHDINAGYGVAKMMGVGEGYNINGTGIYSWSGVNNSSAWNGGVGSVRYTNYTGNANNYTSAYYFAKSEQTPCAISLGVNIGVDNTVSKACGYVIMPLPDCDDSVISTLEMINKDISSVTNLSIDLDNIDDVVKTITGTNEINCIEESNFSYKCDCNEDRIKSVILAMGKKDAIEAMENNSGILELTCNFCNKKYRYNRDYIEKIFMK